MKKFLCLLIAVSGLAISASAQTKITAKEAAQHIGDSLMVCDKVYGGRFFEPNGLTLLNLGGAFPNHQLTVVMKADVRKKFAAAPETAFANKDVCVLGKITEYRGKPQIEIYDIKQLVADEKK